MEKNGWCFGIKELMDFKRYLYKTKILTTMNKNNIKKILLERTGRNDLPSEQELANYLARSFPEETPEQKLFNDHWGLYSAHPDKIVQRVLLCTTATAPVVNYFIKNKYDILVSHHDNLHSLEQVPQIIFHSTMDMNQKGHNQYFLKRMGLNNLRQKHDVAVEGDLYKPLTKDQFIEYLGKHGFEVKGLVWESPEADNQIQHVLYCSGGGGMLLGPNHIIDLSQVTADVYVTGELYTHPRNTPNQFKYIIELGHTPSEKPIFKWVRNLLHNRWSNLQIDLAPDDIDYFGVDSYKAREEEYAQRIADNPNYGQQGFNFSDQVVTEFGIYLAELGVEPEVVDQIDYAIYEIENLPRAIYADEHAYYIKGLALLRQNLLGMYAFETAEIDNINSMLDDIVTEVESKDIINENNLDDNPPPDDDLGDLV